MTDSDQEFNFNDLLSELSQGLRGEQNSFYTYKPHGKQVAFHSSVANGRQFLGGNRSGKTVAGINEDIAWALGEHWYFDLPKPPIHGRIITVDFKNGANKIIVPKLKEWIPPSKLIEGSWEKSYNGNDHVLTLENGSTIEIMSHEQELDKFAGSARHWVHFDEEPPQDIFEECKARLVDYNGRWWMTMTPVDGMTWTYDEIYDKRGNGLIDVVEVHQDDNPYLSQEGRETLQAGYNEDQKSVRAAGRYIAVSGLVFQNFDPQTDVIPSISPLFFLEHEDKWTHYRSLDHGYNNPTAVYWHSVNNKTGDIITWKEHYHAEMTVQQHAEILNSDEAELKAEGINLFVGIADPAIKQRSALTGLSIQIEYGDYGIHWALGAVRDVNAGLDKMNNYLRLDKWKITEDCPNLIREMRMYKRAAYATQRLRDKNNKREDPQKKNDHGIDSTRYFFSFMPDLNIQDISDSARMKQAILSLQAQADAQLGARVVSAAPISTKFDTNLSRPRSKNVAFDEFIGEY